MRSRRSDSTYQTCWEDYSSPLLPPQHEKELEQLEAEINPALNDDPQVALSYLLTKAIDNMKAIPEVTVCTILGTYSKHSNILLPLQTWIFHDPVPAKNFPDYNKIIRRPMDLGSMRKVRPHTPSLSEQSSILSPLPRAVRWEPITAVLPSWLTSTRSERTHSLTTAPTARSPTPPSA